MPDYQYIGRRIQEIRLRKGMSKTAFCDMAGITYYTLRNYETGKQKPKAEILYMIAKETGFSLDWIYGLSKRERWRE
ncbi:helix-turn-helix domain-containing protein [Anaerotignum sp.]